MSDKFLFNDVKKGTPIRFQAGDEGEMCDSKKGIIRTVRRKSVIGGGMSIGSCYIDDIAFAKIDGEWIRLSLTEGQQKLLNTVRKAIG